MNPQTDQGFVPEVRFAPPLPEADKPSLDQLDKPSLDQLVAGTRDLYAETTAQFRDIGELAFMEFELAIKSLQWGILALLMFGACSIMACTFLMVATVLVFVESNVSPTAVMLICGAFSIIAACFLYLCLRSLTKKMTFRNLRSHLTQLRDDTSVKT